MVPRVHTFLGVAAVGVALLASPATADSPTWDPPAGLGVANSDVLKVVTDQAGNDMALWTRDAASGRGQVVFARRPDGGSWSTPQVLARTTQPGIADLAIASDGQLTAVWATPGANGTTTLNSAAALSTPWTGWTGPHLLGIRQASISRLSLAAAANKRAVVSWTEDNGTRLRAFVARRDISGVWQTPRRLSKANAIHLPAGVSDAGLITAGWCQLTGCWTQRWKRGGIWADPQRVTSGAHDDPVLSFAPDGSGAFAFDSRDFTRIKIRLAGPGGVWGPATTLDAAPHTFAGSRLVIVARPAGGWGTAWTKGHEVWVREYDGAAWLAPVMVHRLDGAAADLRLVYLGDDATLIWNERLPVAGARFQVRSLTRTTGTWATSPVAISGDPAKLANLQVAGNAAGHLVTAWHLLGTTPDQVWSATGTWPPPA